MDLQFEWKSCLTLLLVFSAHFSFNARPERKYFFCHKFFYLKRARLFSAETIYASSASADRFQLPRELRLTKWFCDKSEQLAFSSVAGIVGERTSSLSVR